MGVVNGTHRHEFWEFNMKNRKQTANRGRYRDGVLPPALGWEGQQPFPVKYTGIQTDKGPHRKTTYRNQLVRPSQDHGPAIHTHLRVGAHTKLNKEVAEGQQGCCISQEGPATHLTRRPSRAPSQGKGRDERVRLRTVMRVNRRQPDERSGLNKSH